MRVIAGEFRSRHPKALPVFGRRPTPDRLREALFNVLAPQIQRAVFLDAYAGSGAVGIEALSRGASRAIFIEKQMGAVRVIRENLASLELEDSDTDVHSAAVPALSQYQAHIYFLDPPYDSEGEYKAALALLDASPSLVLVQHSKRLELPQACGFLRRTRTLPQGDNAITFYSMT